MSSPSKSLKSFLIYSYFYFTAAVFGYENGYGVSPPEYKTSETFTWYNIPIWGWILIALPIMGIIAICVALAAWKIISQIARYETYESSRDNYTSSSRNSSQNVKILCPLCVKKISQRSWKSGRHRQKCARKYSLKIQNEWPVFQPAVMCPVCSQKLRKIANSRLFKCSLCPTETIHIGCFTCDFNLCQPCINHQRAQQLIEVVELNQTTQDLTLPASRAENLGQLGQYRNFVPPKSNPMLDMEPSAPSYELVVSDENDEHLPSYEEAVALEEQNIDIAPS